MAKAPSHAGARPLLTIRRTSGWRAVPVGEIWAYRDLMLALAVRDLKLRYKQTVLGVVWVVLQPLAAAGIFSFVFGKVAKLPSGGLPYFVFSYAGLLGWNLFSATLTKSSNSLVSNAQLVSKVYFPRMVLPLAVICAALVDFLVAFAVMAALMAMYGVPYTAAMLTLPIWLAILVTTALGAGLWLAALMVTYRDVQHVLPVATQMVLYASPVAYAVAAVPYKWRGTFQLNPLCGILEAIRWSLLGQGELSIPYIAYAALVALLLFAGGALAFRKMEREFADVI